MSDKWYNVLPGVNCVFAMDYDCPVNYNGTVVNYTNNNSKTLTALDGLVNKVYKTEFSAYKVKGYRYLLDTIYKYKALRLDNINFRAPAPIILPENCTVIFVGKVESSSVFMSGENRVNHGLCIDNHGDANYRHSWRIDSAIFRSPHNITEKDSTKFGTYVDTVILKGNKFTTNVECITSYGTFKHNSNGYINKQVPHFPIIGFQDNAFKPDAYIVAYGVFDKQLSQEEIDTVLEKIDEQFLVSSSSSSSITVQKLSKYEVDLDSYLGIPNMVELKSHKVIEGSALIDTEYYIKDININEYGEIKDYIYEEEEPTNTKLFLIDRDTGKHIATTFSNSNGYFEFKSIDKSREYLVVAPHLNYQFRAIVKDYIPRNSK